MKVRADKRCKSGAYAPFICLVFFSLFCISISIFPKTAEACCWACSQNDCDAAVDFIEEAHEDIRNRVKDEFDDDLEEFHEWLVYMLETQFAVGTAHMLNQLAATGMKYTEVVGSFLDAQLQMETQRIYRKLQFDAHKSYRPSESFCTFGSNVRALAASNTISRYNSLALSQISLRRQLGQVDIAGAYGEDEDYLARWNQFVDTYCDIGDNNWESSTTGLELACDHDGPGGSGDDGAEDTNRFNRDIDYTRLIDSPRTLYVDLADDYGTSEDQSLDIDTMMEPLDTAIGTGVSVGGFALEIREPGEEEDVIAMSKNLYGHKTLSRRLSQTEMTTQAAQKLYLALRSVAAKRGVAQASFNAIVGLKSSGTSHEKGLLDLFALPLVVLQKPLVGAGTLMQKRVGLYMASIINELLPSTNALGGNIFDLIGYSPSYYAQLEVLAKRIYQNPDFYADLYDTPSNVARKRVAMQAIELMVDRAAYESQLRREMIVSVLLASRLREAHRNANDELDTASKD